MDKYLGLIGASLILLAGQGVAIAQQSKARAVEQYTCKDVMRESGAERDVAIAFLHGFILGKSGASNFDLDLLHKHSNAFIEHCLDHPVERALDVMTKIKG